MVKFEELRLAERILLLRAFDYNVDPEGFITNPMGNRIPSKEVRDGYLTIEDAMIVSYGRGSIEVLDGTATSISNFLEKIQQSYPSRQEVSE